MLKCLKGYEKMADQRQGVVIHFYGRHRFATPSLEIPLEENTRLSCEQICVQSAIQLSECLGQYFPENSRKIGPLLLPLFGLYAKDHELQQWIPDAHIFSAGTTDLQEFYFRVRIRPAIQKNEESEDDVVSSGSLIPDGIFADYLFWQCVEDFLSGRVWIQFDKDIKINDVACVNKVALWILIGSANYLKQKKNQAGIEGMDRKKEEVLAEPLSKFAKMEDIRGKVNILTIRQHLPKTMSPELQKMYNLGDPIMRILANRHFNVYIKEFYEDWKGHSLGYIRRVFVDTFMTKFVPYYLLENFPAHLTETINTREQMPAGKLDLVIRPHLDGCHPAIYCSRTKSIAELAKIFAVELKHAVNPDFTETEEFIVDLRLSPPKLLRMKNREFALSFLSVLESYCRLKFHYYLSLNQEYLTAPSLQVLIAFRSFGPMTETEAYHHLNQQRTVKPFSQYESIYLIYQDIEEFNLLHVMVAVMNSDRSFTNHDIHFHINNTTGDNTADTSHRASFEFTVDNNDMLFHKPVDLATALSLRDSRQLTPREEDVCGPMKFLEDGLFASNIYSEAYQPKEKPGRERNADLEHPPLSFRSDQVAVTENNLISTEPVGMFADVYQLSEEKTGFRAVLKKVTSDQREIQEAYRKGAEHLLKLRACSPLFVQLYGTVILSPFRMVLQEVGTHKKLRQRLPVNCMQMVSVWEQLAECLKFLKQSKLVYGSFSCDKILIHKENSTALTIKLGDPSRTLFFDSLPVSDVHNQSRKPWIAPERLKTGSQKLSKPTFQTDVFDFGNVVFETIFPGNPLQLLPKGITPRNNIADGKSLQDLILEKMMALQGNSPRAMSNDAASSPQQQEVSPDLAQASSMTDSSDCEQHCYRKVAAPASQAGSTVASGETALTVASDEIAVTVASGETMMTNLSTASDSDAEEPYHAIRAKLLESVTSLLEKCWNRDPLLRHEPLTLMNAVSGVAKLADKLRAADDCSIHLQLIELAGENGMLSQDKLETYKARLQNLQVQQDAMIAQEQNPEQEETEKYKEELLRQVNGSLSFLIHPDLIEELPRKKEGGSFGEVVIAILRKPSSDWRSACDKSDKGRTVAVKTVKEKSQSQQFMKEVVLNSKLEHSNIVRVIGVVIQGSWFKLVMEYADKGTLEKRISQMNSGMLLYKKDMRKFAIDIAKGMEYLCQEMKMIHGDLATRNVLLFSGEIAKVADFGFSHKLSRGQKGIYCYDMRRSTFKPRQWPMYWMSREVLEDLMGGQLVYMTYKSDVWSYGVTLWEMFTGLCPARDLNPNKLEKNELLKDLKARYDKRERLSKHDCPKAVYDIMMKCWEYNYSDRPDFTQLIQMLEDLNDNDLD